MIITNESHPTLVQVFQYLDEAGGQAGASRYEVGATQNNLDAMEHALASEDENTLRMLADGPEEEYDSFFAAKQGYVWILINNLLTEE